jgi:hypothetical protein
MCLALLHFFRRTLRWSVEFSLWIREGQVRTSAQRTLSQSIELFYLLPADTLEYLKLGHDHIHTRPV